MSLPVATPGQLYESLRKIIDLPDNVVSLALHLVIDKAPVMTLTRHVSLVEHVDVTSLDSTARTHLPEAVVHTTRTTRYHLVEISE